MPTLLVLAHKTLISVPSLTTLQLVLYGRVLARVPYEGIIPHQDIRNALFFTGRILWLLPRRHVHSLARELLLLPLLHGTLHPL